MTAEEEEKVPSAMSEPLSKKQRLSGDQIPEIKYTKIFINNEWVDSGKLSS